MIQMAGRGAGPLNTQSIHYRIGDIAVSLQSELVEVLEDFTALYRGCPEGTADSDRTIRMEVRVGNNARLGRKRYLIFGDGKRLGSERRWHEILPSLEWGINSRVIATQSNFLQLHAATMVYRGKGVIFAGPSGCGKSTLAAALLSRGWRYLSDEFALINPNTLRLHPFPKALCIKRGAFKLIQRMSLRFAGRYHYVKRLKGRVGYINPFEGGRKVIGEPSPIRFVVFPKYTDGGEPHLYPVPRPRAVLALAGCALNRNDFDDGAVSILSRVARGAQCFSLESGPIDTTCSLIESVLSRA